MNASFRMINDQKYLYFGFSIIFHTIPLAKYICILQIMDKNKTDNIVSTCKKENQNPFSFLAAFLMLPNTEIQLQNSQW